ncbi:MAG: hypothetical protein EPN85_06135 [Bacteroidetes bacterium]|nr:MAG: hypothetical protein EPN85_06135 [Bacteroidota bacterium]
MTNKLQISKTKFSKNYVILFLISYLSPFGGAGGGCAFSQNIGINTAGNPADGSAMLDVSSASKGMLIPRVALTITTNNAPVGAGVATSLLVYNTATINDVTPGYYYWTGTAWARFSTGSGGGSWLLLGNSGTVDGTNFLGTIDDKPLNFRVNNIKAGRIETNSALGNVFLGYRAGNVSAANGMNTAIGSDALKNTTSGTGNVAIGVLSLAANIDGSQNTAVGHDALTGNSSGGNNVAIGESALRSNTASLNTAVGSWALLNNSTGSSNTAIGWSALYGNGQASQNIAIGSSALYSQSFGGAPWNSNNVAVGFQSLYLNQPASTSDGDANVAVGAIAMYSNITGRYNVAVGLQALTANNGHYNVAIGRQAMWQATSGESNTGIGMNVINSLTTGDRNTGLGYGALWTNSTGNNNTAVGYIADVSAFNLDNATAIGSGAIVNASNKVRLGNTFATIVIEGQTAWTNPSDGRFKYNVNEEVKGLDFIIKLRPVNYQFDTKKFDEFLMKNMPDSVRVMRINGNDYSLSQRIMHTGFIAQEVEKAAKECGYYSFDGVHVPVDDNDNYSVAYSQFVVPLVKAVQEQQKIIDSGQPAIDKLQAENKKLKAEFDSTLKKLEELSGIRKTK